MNLKMEEYAACGLGSLIIMVFFFGIYIGIQVSESKAIKAGSGQYNSTTGQFEYIACSPTVKKP